MTTLEVVLIAAALALALLNAVRVSRLQSELTREGHARQYLESSLRNLRDEMQQGLSTTRGHLNQIQSGERLDAAMVLEGRPFADVDGERAQQLMETHGEALFLLDVRTRGEHAASRISGARLIPIDELSRRLSDLPAPETSMLVYCQGGGRSSAACQMLAERGYGSLFNLAGGIGAWRGPIETGPVTDS